MIERMCLSPLLPVMSVYRLQSGHLTRKGAVCHIRQDSFELVRQLPRTPETLPIIIVRKGEGTPEVKDFRVNRARLIAVGQYLVQNYPKFQEYECAFSTEVAETLPEDGYITGLTTMQESELAEKTAEQGGAKGTV